MYVGCMIAQDTPSSLAELLIFDFVEGRSSAKKVPACKFFFFGLQRCFELA